MDKDGKLKESFWLDAKRIVLKGARVMEPPNFMTIVAKKENGAAEKPTRSI